MHCNGIQRSLCHLISHNFYAPTSFKKLPNHFQFSSHTTHCLPLCNIRLPNLPFPMKPSSNPTFFASSTTVTYTYHNDHTTPPQHTNSTQLPSPSQSQSTAALTIQSTYRAHRIRTLYHKIAAVDSKADQLQRLIQHQDTVDAVRTNHLEKLKMNEALMSLLLKLDSVPGIDPTVREARRKVTRRIVSLQEILDSVSETKLDQYNWLSLNSWDEVLAQMEESVCRDRGGDEMEKFCAQNLGFRCLQRFLREP